LIHRGLARMKLAAVSIKQGPRIERSWPFATLIRKEVKFFVCKNSKVTIRDKPTSVHRARQHVEIVRRARGRNANGDSLLRSALLSMAQGDNYSAWVVLGRFRDCPDLKLEHRVIADNARRQLAGYRQVIWPALTPMIRVASWAVRIGGLVSAWAGRNPVVFLLQRGVSSYESARTHDRESASQVGAAI
jgi:hypothetical protein